MHDLIGPDVRLYWDQAVYKKPGTEEFRWHQDNGYTFIEPQQYLTCWVALTDTDEKNGCPWVVPGLSDGVRKAYIVQFAPDGAQLYRSDAAGYESCDAPERQFRVLQNGQ